MFPRTGQTSLTLQQPPVPPVTPTCSVVTRNLTYCMLVFSPLLNLQYINATMQKASQEHNHGIKRRAKETGLSYIYFIKSTHGTSTRHRYLVLAVFFPLDTVSWNRCKDDALQHTLDGGNTWCVSFFLFFVVVFIVHTSL